MVYSIIETMFKRVVRLVNYRKIADRILWPIIASPVCGGFRTHVCHTRYHLVEGKTKVNNRDLRTVVLGSNEFLHYMTRLVYSEHYQVEKIGKTALDRAISVADVFNPDVVFAEFHGIFSKAMTRDFLILPDLTWTLDITPPLEILISKVKRIRRRCIKKIEQRTYAYEYTNDADKLKFFYNRMYAPYISKIHADSARLVSMKLSEKILRKGNLLLVKSRDGYVSGILFSRTNSVIHCALLGINLEIGREIDGQAALYGLIKWAKQKGYKEIGYGETSPFMSDGLFEYKRTWGMRIKPYNERALGIRVCTFSEGTLDFLANNPLVFGRSDNLAMLMLLDLGNIDPKWLRRKYYTPGLTQVVAIHPAGKSRIQASSSFDSSENQLFATPLLRELLKKNYCAHLLTFKQSEADGFAPHLQAE